MTVGEVYWIEFPPANGHEQAGRRPAIVLQDDLVAGSLPLVLVIPLTTSLRALSYFGSVRIDPTSDNGLTQPSVAMVFQLRAIDRRRVRSRLGYIGHENLTALYSALDALTGRTSTPGSPPSASP